MICFLLALKGKYSTEWWTEISCAYSQLQVAQVEVAEGFKHTCVSSYCILLLSESTTFPQLQVTSPTQTTACFVIYPHASFTISEWN